MSYMILITPKDKLDTLKSRDLVELQCEICSSHFYKPKNLVMRGLKGKRAVAVCSNIKCKHLLLSNKTTERYRISNPNRNIDVQCAFCKKIFQRKKVDYNKYNIKGNRPPCCNRSCAAKLFNKMRDDFPEKYSRGFLFPKKEKEFVTITCTYCKSPFQREKSKYLLRQVRFNKKPYCSKKCQALGLLEYFNSLTCVRSKLEMWIEQKLSEKYPNLTIYYNDRQTINGELDIYIPSIELAFELNGIFHYDPIFGEATLKKRQQKDEEKKNECLVKRIELFVIDCRKERKLKNDDVLLYIISKISERTSQNCTGTSA